MVALMFNSLIVPIFPVYLYCIFIGKILIFLTHNMDK